MPQIENKTRKNSFFFSLGYNVSRKTGSLISLTDLADSQLAARCSSRFARLGTRVLRFFKDNSPARDVFKYFEAFHVIARKQLPKRLYRRIFLSNPD